MTQSEQLLLLLDELQQELEKNQLWQTNMPSEQVLQSEQPFALDTLDPEQWLQWIFIPKIRVMLEQGGELPSGFSMAPYFEQAWQEAPQCQGVIKVTQKIDKVCQPC
ncbi:YqcC family protein [Vibrio sp. ZSDE26]|uniref:YqcC family protein n=1 Tax=Vibrio amylolyticus TaxID=2847292 RepID=A0A9X1XMB0_9VIBR|nr:YqcC family protein [Vibrio amylolyticus]MCK6265336.1 YqcC family protein [Vibrio amylolyticus]